MHTERCPLCYVCTRYEATEHLTRDHRRSYAEACVLVERSKEGTLGRRTVGRKSSHRQLRQRSRHRARILSLLDLSGGPSHRLSAISDSGNRPGDSRQPVQSQ